jgi:sialate O-acetylesterase
MNLPLKITCLFAFFVLWATLHAQGIPKNLPKEDVVQVPAIGEGLCVSNTFQSNMVLQRDKPIAIHGWADPGETVTIGFAGQSAKATAGADRAWQARLAALPASAKPGDMTISGNNKTLKLKNILIGDVWILGGQSNMEFEIAKVNDGMIEIASANFPQIRLLTMPVGKGFDSVPSFERLYEWSDWSNRHFLKGAWQVCTPESVSDFSAIGYIFGRRIHMASRVPIGLIDTSIGGTTVETWTPDKVLQGIEGAETKAKLREWEEKIAAFDPQADLKQQIASFENRKKKLEAEGKTMPAENKPPTTPRPGPVADRNRPGYCYASVIRPLEGLAACGALFHQGYNNCFEGSAGARMYFQVFGGMVRSWRTAFGEEKLPFCIISLCTAGDPQSRERFLEPMFDAGPLIREAQYQTFRKLRDTGDMTIGYASSFDFRKSWYHPQIKIPVGERAAKWALASHYKLLGGRDSEQFWLPPAIEKVEVQDGRIHLTTNTEITTRDDSDGELLGFAIAGEDRRFYPAVIRYLTIEEAKGKPVEDRKVLVLSSPHVSKPVHYRHAWARNPLTNLTNSRQIPLPTLRSDDWIMEETPLVFPAAAGANPAASQRAAANFLRKELQLGDTQRRIQDARLTLERLEPQFLTDQETWEKEKAKQREKARAATPK